MLHTPRSPLIPFDRNDAPLFHAINTDPFVRKYLWDDEVISLRKAEEMIETNHRNFREQGFGLWKIFTMYPMK
jgi:ribosomal-protein-alanine N-acetyltransferase